MGLSTFGKLLAQEEISRFIIISQPLSRKVSGPLDAPKASWNSAFRRTQRVPWSQAHVVVVVVVRGRGIGSGSGCGCGPVVVAMAVVAVVVVVVVGVLVVVVVVVVPQSQSQSHLYVVETVVGVVALFIVSAKTIALLNRFIPCRNGLSVNSVP